MRGIAGTALSGTVMSNDVVAARQTEVRKATARTCPVAHVSRTSVPVAKEHVVSPPRESTQHSCGAWLIQVRVKTELHL